MLMAKIKWKECHRVRQKACKTRLSVPPRIRQRAQEHVAEGAEHAKRELECLKDLGYGGKRRRKWPCIIISRPSQSIQSPVGKQTMWWSSWLTKKILDEYSISSEVCSSSDGVCSSSDVVTDFSDKEEQGDVSQSQETEHHPYNSDLILQNIED